MAITTQMRTDVSQLYVALFGRAPDGEGLGYWVSQLDAGKSIVDIANAMYGTAPARTYYPSYLTNQEIVGNFYTNVLGRTADAEGLAYWTDKLNAAGATPGSVIAEIIGVVANYTGTDPAGLKSAALFQNKVQVAQWYGEQNGNIAGATSILSGVTEDPATVEAAKTGGVQSGQTFTLTTGQDTVIGTSGNDTINGFVNSVVADGNTLNSGDTIDGGVGNDTLKVTIEVATSNDLNLSMKNVERMEIRDFGGQTFYVQDMTGLNTVVKNGGTGWTYFDSGTYVVPNVEFHNVTSGGFEQDMGKVAVIDNLNVLVDNSNTGVYQYSNNTNSRANYKAVTVTSTGAGPDKDAAGVGYNTLYVGESQGAKTVTVKGTTNLDLTMEHWNNPSDATGSIDTVDASGLAAGLTMDIEFEGVAGATKTVNGGTGNDNFTDYSANSALKVNYSTGTGDDVVDLTNGGVTNTYTVDLGAGNDKLVANAVAAGKTLTVTGGDGNDTIDLTAVVAAAIVKVTGDAGDDTVLLAGNLDTLAATSSIDGGTGVNTIGIANGADMTADTVKLFTNFQTLEVKGGTGTYDMSLVPAFTAVTQTGAALTGNVTISKAAAGTTYTVSSAASTDLTDANVVTYGLKDASGTADVAAFTLKAVDGDNDGVAEGNVSLGGITLVNDANTKGIETLKIVSTATADGDNPSTPANDPLTGKDYTNTLVEIAGTSLNKVLDVTADAGLTITTVNANLTALGTIKVAGAGAFEITNALAAATKLTSVDASASTGDVTIDASANTLAINYKGSEGADDFTAGTAGGVIYTGKGADVVDLGASNTTSGLASAADVIVLKAATDSQIVDSSKDGKFTLSDGGFDTITGFETVTLADSATTADKIDVSTLAFSGYAKGVADVSALVTATSTDLTSVADLFADAGGDRGVAYSIVGGNTYVFVDVNKDGNFTAAADLVVELVGVTGLGTGATDVAF